MIKFGFQERYGENEAQREENNGAVGTQAVS